MKGKHPMSAPNAGGRWRVASAICALALGVSGVAVAATAASAAPGNIDFTQKGTITVHLHKANNAAAGEIDGTPAPNPLGDPLVGTFAVYPISSTVFNPQSDTAWSNWATAGAALATNANCNAAASGSGAQFGASVASITTSGATGTGVASNLNLGAYLVCATAVPADAMMPNPFVVTLPSPNGSSWIYNVHAYPKTSVNSLDKTVRLVDDCYAIGCPVDFPVTTNIEVLEAGETYTSLIIRDVLESRLTPMSIAAVTINGAPVPQGPTGYTSSISGQTMTVTIAPAFANANTNKTLEVVFRGSINTLDDDPIENIAHKYVNDPSMTADGEGETDSPRVEITYGGILISKVDTSATGGPLGGARFEVYASNQPYASDCSTGQPTGSALSFNGTTQFNTDDVTGKVAIPGVYVTSTDNGSNAGATSRCYFVREVRAPYGFILPTGNAAVSPVTVTAGATNSASFDVRIVNTRQTVPTLPLTGAAGQILALIGGASALGLAAVLIAVRRRREAQA